VEASSEAVEEEGRKKYLLVSFLDNDAANYGTFSPRFTLFYFVMRREKKGKIVSELHSVMILRKKWFVDDFVFNFYLKNFLKVFENQLKFENFLIVKKNNLKIFFCNIKFFF
jgi:hypothetical protein